MEDFRRYLERQERETNERNRRADEINELQRQVEEQVVIAVALQDEENQGRRCGSQVGHRQNVDRHRHSRGKNLHLRDSLVDEITRMGKSTTLEALVRFCQAVETLYTRDYLRRPTPRDLQRLLQKAEAQGFPGMIGSIDCMHWQWKNCLTALQGDYENRKGQKSIILEVVTGFTHGFGMPSLELPDPNMTSTCWVNPQSSTMY
ncbi:hypothetical protein L3X38_032803 [Prunus dulcis]|uniref:Uncharacterized protein n=1 Tax=Prunus dulcis TaxID=3755 RepID=A0AAD4VGW1_PRUDU|nr:hypothetical protein L3X38_032803 [Prunus dulcis]